MSDIVRPLSRRLFMYLALPVMLAPSLAAAASPAEDYVSKGGNGVIAAARANSVGQFRSLLKANADIAAIAIYSLGPYRKSLTNDVKAEYYGLVENYIAKVFQQYAN